jgi:hypothetical protein
METMIPREQQLQKHAALLLSALVDVHNAAIKFEVLAKEENVHKGTRKQILKCLTEVNQIRQRFDRFWGEEGKKVMDEQILSDDDTLQIQQITELIVQLPKGIRNEIETYVEGRAKIYSTAAKN